MDLGFAAAPEGEGDWGCDDDEDAGRGCELAVLPPEKAPQEAGSPEPERAQDAPGPLLSIDNGAAAAPSKADGAVKRLMPSSKIHSNPRTRYFVIKSGNHKNLVLSVENNVWATQRHNEEKLNEALHNAPHVILIFSVNMSGCFQGYAKMMGAVGSSRKTDVFRGFGRAFDIRWLRLEDLDFREVSDIVNPWNDHKSVKISRDGQELPHDVGRRVCERVDEKVWRADPDSFVTDEKEVETGGFAPALAAHGVGAPMVSLAPPERAPQGGGRLGEGISPGAWAPPTLGPMAGAMCAPGPPGPWPPPPWGPPTPGFLRPPVWKNPWAERSSSCSYSYSSSNSCSDAEGEPRRARQGGGAAPAGFRGAAPAASPFDLGGAAPRAPSAFEPPPAQPLPVEAPRAKEDRPRRRREEAATSARRRRRDDAAGEERRGKKAKDAGNDAKHRRKSRRDDGKADAPKPRKEGKKEKKDKGKSKKESGDRRREDGKKTGEKDKGRRRRRSDATAGIAAPAEAAQSERRKRRGGRSRSRKERRKGQAGAAPPSDWHGAHIPMPVQLVHGGPPSAWHDHGGPPPALVAPAPQPDVAFQ